MNNEFIYSIIHLINETSEEIVYTTYNLDTASRYKKIFQEEYKKEMFFIKAELINN